MRPVDTDGPRGKDGPRLGRWARSWGLSGFDGIHLERAHLVFLKAAGRHCGFYVCFFFLSLIKGFVSGSLLLHVGFLQQQRAGVPSSCRVRVLLEPKLGV